MQLVMPPSPFMAPEAVIGIGVYTAKAVLEGKGCMLSRNRGLALSNLPENTAVHESVDRSFLFGLLAI
jgi:hypothetical protein